MEFTGGVGLVPTSGQGAVVWVCVKGTHSDNGVNELLIQLDLLEVRLSAFKFHYFLSEQEAGVASRCTTEGRHRGDIKWRAKLEFVFCLLQCRFLLRCRADMMLFMVLCA